eukprot:1279025-Pyramimonas_sp.AAC.1
MTVGLRSVARAALASGPPIAPGLGLEPGPSGGGLAPCWQAAQPGRGRRWRRLAIAGVPPFTIRGGDPGAVSFEGYGAAAP